MPQRRFDIVVFDIDGTLIVHPSGRVVWQVLHQRFGGSAAENQRRYRRHLAKEISYEEWVRLDVGDWQRAGARRADLVEALQAFVMVEGARETLATLASRGYRLAAVSGTLDLLVETIFPDHPFDPLFTNQLFFADDGRIERWQATPFDFDGKARALETIAGESGIGLERVAFVGDDINDLGAARAAGLSVAFHPRSEELALSCDIVLRQGPLTQILEHLP